MTKLEALIGEGKDQRIIELFQILDDESTGSIDDIYKSLSLATKIVRSRFNNLTVTNVRIGGVDYYNNCSDRHQKDKSISEELRNNVKNTIRSADLSNQLSDLKFVNTTPTALNMAFYNCVHYM